MPVNLDQLKNPEQCDERTLKYLCYKDEKAAVIILTDPALVNKCYPPVLCAMAEHVEAIKLLSGFSKDWLLEHLGKGCACKLLGLIKPEAKSFWEIIADKLFLPEGVYNEKYPDNDTSPPSLRF